MTPGVTVNQRSINERIQEFRSDPEKMDVTTKFVNEVVEKAKNEALTRMKERDRERSGEGDAEMKKAPETSYGVGSNRKRIRWHSRARGFFSRLFASFCFCSTETQV